MNITKTAETLEGLLDLGKDDSVTIESFGQRLAYSKENEGYNLVLHVTRADAQAKEQALEDGKKAAADKRPSGKTPAGIIIP